MKTRVLVITGFCTACLLVGCVTTGKSFYFRPEPVSILHQAADRVLIDFPSPPPFNWGEGVLMAGMMRAYEVTNDSRYLNFVRNWADHWKRKGIGPLLEKRGYCGHWGPGYPVLMLYEVTHNSDHLSLGKQVVDFMLNEATRTRDGGLDHWRNNRQLWVDTLFMCCPPFANLGRLQSRPELISEAAAQLYVFSRHLQNPKNGLFYHMYDEAKDSRTNEFWGRGNGWVAMSYVEVLKHLDPNSSLYINLARDFKVQAQGLLSMQDGKSGLWHTVLDRNDSYLETSASAMILYSLVEGGRLEIINTVPRYRIRKAWNGLVSKVSGNGRVGDVSAGTGPSNFEKYNAIARGTETWGTGALLLAASALSSE